MGYLFCLTVCISFDKQGGGMLYAQSVGLAKIIAIPWLKPPSQATKTHAWKARSYESQKMVLNEIMLPMR